MRRGKVKDEEKPRWGRPNWGQGWACSSCKAAHVSTAAPGAIGEGEVGQLRGS